MGGGAPCRLFVYLARDAPVGVVLRRGPSDWVRLSRWHTADDSFAHGQWMRARVYERRSDLSPDGELFVAFVRGVPAAPPGHDTWIAISRPPWFTALALWFVGGTYCSGGFFPRTDQLWLGFDPASPDRGGLPSWLSATTSKESYVDRTPDWPDRTVWNNRLLRDGWRHRPDAEPETWERAHPQAPLTLRMILRSTMALDAYGGRFQLEFEVIDEAGVIRPIGRAAWADWDHRGRLVVARDGRLLDWSLDAGPRVIADLNPGAPDPLPAPPEARLWPSPGPA